MTDSLQGGFLRLALVTAFSFYTAVACAQPEFKGLENLLTTPKSYIVGHTSVVPVIDGDISDATWQQAPWTDDFADIEGADKPAPLLRTNFKMLWDDTCLYIAAQVMEPNVWGTLKRHDDIIFMDNDVELFISPTGTTHQYFEIECNALNTIFDLYLPKPYRNLGNPLSTWDARGMRSAVKITGTLNNPADKDKGWTMEMAIPFSALNIGVRPRLPKAGTVWRMNFSRVEWDTKAVDGKYEKLKDSNGHNLPEHNWVWSPQGLINMHYPERWGYVQFAKGRAAGEEFVLPYAEKQKKYLWALYYRQKQWFESHERYKTDLKDLEMPREITIDGKPNELKMEATPHQFIGFITDKENNITYTINDEGLVSILG
ncbi:carbohydrate-binding family 9-like protein [Mucilaginibacter sp. L3T2-6]|uniref:carbohydrate-binding family 9-like protein n=1 Tax=Mucilaginibacter sp. L3T2-6 TaxID=3062491 RepID=UPI002675D53A|nr:carbohydrate-binding family 9-like protein [Mucilaginibacter sp. L3T2-6]MDO3642520.1 carbohydrate-binding family 9-like protein [Mucilaginibacter sp. L3T2-6]MDV6215084.1 carbohydrate-binding family 9-like protein [Mucilaginibacter sp. L3T2-6]